MCQKVFPENFVKYYVCMELQSNMMTSQRIQHSGLSEETVIFSEPNEKQIQTWKSK